MKTLEEFDCYEQVMARISKAKGRKRSTGEWGSLTRKVKGVPDYGAFGVQDAVFMMKEEEPSLTKDQVYELLEGSIPRRTMERHLSSERNFDQAKWDRMAQPLPTAGKRSKPGFRVRKKGGGF